MVYLPTFTIEIKNGIYIYHTLDPMGDMFRGALNEVVPSFFSGKLEVVPCFYRVEYGKFRISLNIRVALEQQKLVHLVQLSFKTMIQPFFGKLEVS